jgi:hypothetical protein
VPDAERHTIAGDDAHVTTHSQLLDHRVAEGAQTDEDSCVGSKGTRNCECVSATTSEGDQLCSQAPSTLADKFPWAVSDVHPFR